MSLRSQVYIEGKCYTCPKGNVRKTKVKLMIILKENAILTALCHKGPKFKILSPLFKK